MQGKLAQKSVETVRPTKNSPPRNHVKYPYFTHRKETSQPISNVQSIDWFPLKKSNATQKKSTISRKILAGWELHQKPGSELMKRLRVDE